MGYLPYQSISTGAGFCPSTVFLSGKTIREKKKTLIWSSYVAFGKMCWLKPWGVSSKAFPVVKGGFRYPQLLSSLRFALRIRVWAQNTGPNLRYLEVQELGMEHPQHLKDRPKTCVVSELWLSEGHSQHPGQTSKTWLDGRACPFPLLLIE